MSAPSEFKCCAGTTAPGLRLRRNRFLVYETRLKQSACSMAVGSVLAKCPPAAFPPPLPGRGPPSGVRKRPLPRGLFLLQAAELPLTFFPAQQARRQSDCHTRVSASGRNVHFAPGSNWRYAHSAVSLALKSKAPPGGAGRAKLAWQSSRGDVLLPSQTPNWRLG